jgi:hypothetical protein
VRRCSIAPNVCTIGADGADSADKEAQYIVNAVRGGLTFGAY